VQKDSEVLPGACWLAAALLTHLHFHELGHFIVGWTYRRLVPDPRRKTPARVFLLFGPRRSADPDRKFKTRRLFGFGLKLKRSGVWCSPFSLAGPAMCWISGESRFPRGIRVVYALAGSLAQVVPSTRGLIVLLALPRDPAWAAYTGFAFLIQVIALMNLFALGSRFQGRKVLLDGGEIARTLRNLTVDEYFALPRWQRGFDTALSVILMLALLGIIDAACGFCRGDLDAFVSWYFDEHPNLFSALF
jgi:hypothetical protein